MILCILRLLLLLAFFLFPVSVVAQQGFNNDRTIEDIRSRSYEMERRLTQLERETAAIPFLQQKNVELQNQVLRGENKYDTLLWAVLSASVVSVLNLIAWGMRMRDSRRGDTSAKSS